MICEAGTGYNNIPLEAARAKGITVCNIPAYSTQRVAHTAVMLMLNLASSMQKQIRMLAAGDRRNFTEHLLVPHVELNGKSLGVIGAGNIGRCVIKIARALDIFSEAGLLEQTRINDERVCFTLLSVTERVKLETRKTFQVLFANAKAPGDN